MSGSAEKYEMIATNFKSLFSVSLFVDNTLAFRDDDMQIRYFSISRNNQFINVECDIGKGHNADYYLISKSYGIIDNLIEQYKNGFKMPMTEFGVYGASLEINVNGVFLDKVLKADASDFRFCYVNSIKVQMQKHKRKLEYICVPEISNIYDKLNKMFYRTGVPADACKRVLFLHIARLLAQDLVRDIKNKKTVKI